MSDATEAEIEEYVEMLKENGWSREEALQFLDDQIVYKLARIPSRFAKEAIIEACKAGVPLGEIQVLFMVPKKRVKEFENRLETVAAKHRGFMVSTTDQTILADADPSKVN